MSDEEYEYEYDSDAEYDYGSEGGGSEQDDSAIEIENTFYEADDCKADEPKRSLELFRKVVRLEEADGQDKIKWRFKALEHIVKLEFQLTLFEDMLKSYTSLLSFMDSVTRNECTDTINSVLDTIGASKDESKRSSAEYKQSALTLSKIYHVTLDALKESNNERLWFNTNIKMGKMLLEHGDYTRLNDVIKELHQSCAQGKIKDDPNIGTYLLEVYALEIALCGATGRKKKLKDIYPKTRTLNAAIQDPRIMGGIHESGGKMYMEDGQWSDAYDEFFEGFRNYQEAGNQRAKQCLKYVVLANMIALKDINPFDSREAKVYKDDPEIQAMMNLRHAFETSDIHLFEKVLHDKRTRIAEDPFIRRYIENLLTNIRSQVLLTLVKPYRFVKLDFLAKELNVDKAEVENLLVELIFDEKIEGRINQKDGFIELFRGSAVPTAKKHVAIEEWTRTVESLQDQLHNRTVMLNYK